MRIISKWAGFLFLAFFIGIHPAIQTQAKSLNFHPSSLQTANFTLDGVNIFIRAPFIPGPFTSSEPSDAIQMATAAQLGDYQEIAITTIPYGTRAPTENLPTAKHGSENIYRQELSNRNAEQEISTYNGPTAHIFGTWVPGTYTIEDAPIQSSGLTPILMVEWVTEVGNRVWIIRIGQLYEGSESLAEMIESLSQLEIGSPDPNLPSASVEARKKTVLLTTPPIVLSPDSLFAASNLPFPAWWHGDCDTDYYVTQGAKIPAKPLGAIFRGMKACGPRPYFDNVPDVLVRFYTGAWGEYEWECVELSMRYLYLAHNTKPYSGNGKDVVTNYRINNPNGELVVVKNDTVGTFPVPGDILSYGTSGWGHTSVVMASDVTSSNGTGTITVIEQNNSATGSKVLTVSNWHVYASTIVTGWLHDPYQITGLSIDNTKIAENKPVGTLVGTFTAIDQNPNTTHTYELVSGTGDSENIFFTIEGNQLKSFVTLNYEILNSYKIRVRVTNNNGDVYEKSFIITATDANDPPSDMTLSNTKIAEQKPVGTTIGTLKAIDEDATGSYTYSLVNGTGSDDNGLFSINGNSLVVNSLLDYETKNIFTIRLKVTDQGGLSAEKPFSISITDIYESPSNISISTSSIGENQVVGTTIGTLSVSDPDANDTHTITLVAGNGDSDNGSFSISGNILKSKIIFDFETKKSYSIRLRATDKSSLILEKVFNISITNANDPPTGIQLSKTSIAENQSNGIEVGSLSATDQDSTEPFTYTLVTGTGSTDNNAFTLSGKILKTAVTLDYEVKSTMIIRVRVTDNTGLSYEKQFMITVTNNNDPPTGIKISKSNVSENQPLGTIVGILSAVDQGSASDTFIFGLAAGSGDSDNSLFTISGSSLLTNAVFDAEKRSLYSIRIRTVDNGGLSFEQVVTITISGVNEFAPTNLTLDINNVAENQAVGIALGSFSTTDLDLGDIFTYSLVAGAGSQDNSSFSISGSTLKTKKVFNFEVKNSYSIRVRTTDKGGFKYEKSLSINILDMNDQPTGIQLDPSIQAENTSTDTLIGSLVSTDEDAGDTYSYALVTGAGSDDNSSFILLGNQITNKIVFDYETKNTYTIRIRTTDKGGLSFELPLSIKVTPINEYPPTDVLLDRSSVGENLPLGSPVGLITSIDQDKGDTMIYELVSGSGSDDNSLFSISGNQLLTNAVFDHNLKNVYTVRLLVTDSGQLSFEKAIQITIEDRLEIYLPFVQYIP